MKNVFTDGCCFGNSGPPRFRRAGAGIFFQEEQLDISRTIDGAVLRQYDLEHRTNQVAELLAILWALERISVSPDPTWTLHTDSMYAMNASTKWLHKWKRSGWLLANKQPVKNASIIRHIDACLARCANSGIHVTFAHVKAHHTSYGNNRADYLAKMAAASS